MLASTTPATKCRTYEPSYHHASNTTAVTPSTRENVREVSLSTQTQYIFLCTRLHTYNSKKTNSIIMSAADEMPPIYNLSPPYDKITDEDHGGYVVVSGWILMCFFVTCVSARLATRFTYLMAGGIDDILVGVAMAFGIAQTAVVHNSASSGLGQHQDNLSDFSFGTYAKNYYYANMLFVLALLFSKLSTIFLLMRLAPKPRTRHTCQVVGTLFSVWALGSIISLAFQCDLPRPWDYRGDASGQCSVNGAALNYSIMILDVVTDVVCIVIPVSMLWNLQMSSQRRWPLIGAFGCRGFVCICSAIRIATLVKYYGTTDRSWEAVAPQTWAQVVQCVSIMTACIPSLKVFLGSFESGFMNMSMRIHGGPTYRTDYAYGTAKSGSAKHSGHGSKQHTGNSYALTSLSKDGLHQGTMSRAVPASPDSVARAGSDTESTSHLRRHSFSGDAGQGDDGIMVTREVHIRAMDDTEVRQQHNRIRYFQPSS